MAWALVVIAGLLEVVWATAMKQSAGFTRLIPTVVTALGIVVSLGLLASAMRVLPLGTAYAVWTGIGAVGAFVVGVLILGEPPAPTRVLAASLILAGIVLMKVSAST